MAPALKAAKANAVARRGRRAVGLRTDDRDWGWGVGTRDWWLVIGGDCNPMAEDRWQRAEKNASTTVWERTFSGAASAARNGMTAPRLTTSATPPASISRDKRANCFRRRKESLDQRRVRVLSIWGLKIGYLVPAVAGRAYARISDWSPQLRPRRRSGYRHPHARIIDWGGRKDFGSCPAVAGRAHARISDW